MISEPLVRKIVISSRRVQSRPDFEIFSDIAQACEKPFAAFDTKEVQDEIEKVAPTYEGMFPGKKSKQWQPANAGGKASFTLVNEWVEPQDNETFPFKLITNNHMFHIGSYTQHAKSLVDIGPECLAEINREDAKSLNLEEGDRIRVESDTDSIELPVAFSTRSTPGVVYVPKNWTDIPVNNMRNGHEGLVSVKISKVG